MIHKSFARLQRSIGRSFHGIPPSLLPSVISLGILTSGKQATYGAFESPSFESLKGRNVLLFSPKTTTGQNVASVARHLGMTVTEVDASDPRKKYGEQDLAVILSSQDDLRTAWRSLSYMGSIVVVGSSTTNNINNAKVSVNVGLSIFKGLSIHGFDSETFLSGNERGEDVEQSSKLGQAVAIAKDIESANSAK